jgi:hypothetical protein
MGVKDVLAASRGSATRRRAKETRSRFPDGPSGHRADRHSRITGAPLSLSVRDDRLIANRLRYGIKNAEGDLVLIDLNAARVLLQRLEERVREQPEDSTA